MVVRKDLPLSIQEKILRGKKYRWIEEAQINLIDKNCVVVVEQ